MVYYESNGPNTINRTKKLWNYSIIIASVGGYYLSAMYVSISLHKPKTNQKFDITYSDTTESTYFDGIQLHIIFRNILFCWSVTFQEFSDTNLMAPQGTFLSFNLHIT